MTANKVIKQRTVMFLMFATFLLCSCSNKNPMPSNADDFSYPDWPAAPKLFGGTVNSRGYAIAKCSSEDFIVASNKNSELNLIRVKYSDGSAVWDKTYGAVVDRRISLADSVGGNFAVLYCYLDTPSTIALRFLKLDLTGNYVTAVETQSQIFPGLIRNTDDGGFMFFLAPGYIWTTRIVRTDTGGNAAWTKDIPPPNLETEFYSDGSYADMLDSGEIVIAGASSYGFQQTSVFIRMDAAGNTNLVHIFNDLSGMNDASVVSNPDGGFTYVAVKRSASVTGKLYYKRVNNSGGVIVHNSPDLSFKFVRMPAIKSLSDNGVLILINTDTYPGNSMLVKLDNSGGLIWKKTVNGIIRDMLVHDGKYYLVGSLWNLISGTWAENMYVTCIDENGGYIW